MLKARMRNAARKCWSLMATAGASAIALTALSTTETQNAVANGDTRTISLFHSHTNETITATFMVDGQYDGRVLEKLNWFLRDWRLDEPVNMDPRLFDTIWATYRESGSREPMKVMSAYRSPRTNAMLRRRSKAVAENSQHMVGKAMDIHFVDVPMSRVREIGMRLQRGGVGYYPSAGSPFVHLDVGSVRAWPRMSYDQLARIFPDGKTVHIPSNGQPLARYEEARAELAARGGALAPTLAQVKMPGFLAFLFGGGEDEDVAATRAPAPTRNTRGRQQVASLGRATGIGPAPIAAPANGDDNSAAAFFRADAARLAPQAPVQTQVVARAQTNLPRGETFLSPAPTQSAPVQTAAPAPAPQPVAIAALDPRLQDRAASLPLPPRRPDDLPLITASIPALAPLPPVRPVELASLVTPRASNGSASAAKADAIAGLIGTFSTVPPPRGRDLPKIITQGTSLQQKPSAPGVMSYAPEDSLLARSVIMTKSTSIIPTPPTTARPSVRSSGPAKKADLVAARLDRSNFRSLTASVEMARVTTPTVLGSTVAPLRPAGRVDARALVFSSASELPASFEARKPEFDSKSFSGSALQAPAGSDQRADAAGDKRVN